MTGLAGSKLITNWTHYRTVYIAIEIQCNLSTVETVRRLSYPLYRKPCPLFRGCLDTTLCSWDSKRCPLERCAIFHGVLYRTFPL